jgi:DNA repair protein RecO (recombination protein O)
MPLLKTAAITLKSRKWGDADRIVTLFTVRYGKLRGIARGARRMKSRFGSALEPFVHCDLNLFEKPNDSMHRVTQADIRETFPKLREDLAVMAGAARLANLVTAITAEGDPCPGVFDTLLGGLRVLNEGGDPGLSTLLFQIRLLGQTGFRPQTDHCTTCSGALTEREAAGQMQFAPLAGGLVCTSCANRRSDRPLPLSPGSRSFLQQVLQFPISALTRLKATGLVRDELETAIEAYVMVVAGKRLPPVDFLAAAEREPAYGSKR